MDSDAWDERYAGDELVWKAEPNRFLVSEVADLAPGRALDLACGEGRNAVWLAAGGWQVTGVDFSPAGLAKAERLASATTDASIEWIEADVTTWVPPEQSFDLILVFYLHLPAPERRRVLAAAAGALAPGGTFLLVGHDRDNLERGVGGPQVAEILCVAADIVADLVAAEPTLAVERAEQVTRTVETDDGERTAIDTLVRVRRP